MPAELGLIPAEVRGLKRWVCCSDGDKAPRTCYGEGYASVSRPETWSTFGEAAARVEAGDYPWVGFVFAGDGIVGIDIDHCVVDGVPTDDAMEAVRACASYTELSRSGTGLHILVKGELPFAGRKEGAWEAYADGRFFLLTGRRLGPWSGVESNQAGINAVVSAHLSGGAAGPARPGGRRPGAPIWRPEWRWEDPGRVPLSPEWPEVAAGGRHLAMVSYCGRLVDMGWPDRAVRASAREANRLHMRPPLPEAEVDAVSASCLRYRGR